MSERQQVSWKITLELSGKGDGLVPRRFFIEIDNAWVDDPGHTRPALECLCIDIGSIVKALLGAAPIVPKGDAVDAFKDGFED